jgi:peptidoglycan/LPS O-acetylase OafA/YrhL
MKKTILVFVIAALVLTAAGIWFFSSDKANGKTDILEFGVIVLIVGFAVFAGFRRLSSARRSEPAEDELSKNIISKAAGLSYYISLYMWLGIMYFSDRLKLETHSIIGLGIIGMAVVFTASWLVFNFRGIKND